MSFLRNLGIHHRVLLLALIPTLLVTLVLTVATTYQRLQDARDDLLQDGFLMLDYLALGGEYGVLSGNLEALEQLARPASNTPSVADITFLDADGNPLRGRQRVSRDTLSQWEAEGYRYDDGRWQLYRSIKLSTLPVDDFNTAADKQPVLLGWVLMELSDTALQQKEHNILLLGILIATSGLLVAVWLALFIGRTISRPVQQISATVESLLQDQLSARVAVEDGGEIGDLGRGINNLAVQVQRTRDNLQQEVAKATRELHITLDALELQNKQLEQARQRAEQANQTKDQFLARMSHELRTPLTSVLGFVGLLGKTPLDSAQQGYTQVIQRTSSLLLSLIDDLLDFSKLESDAIQLESIEFNLDECVEEVLDMHLASARQKGVEVILVPDPALPERVAGDPTRIGQVLSNLVGNAIKFTQQGEVVVSLSSRLDNGVVRVALEVKDTGIGISERQQANLFKPFTQADSSITRRFGGTGLGLVISRRLTELMGGTLQMDSVAGLGTRVRIELQLKVLSTAPPAQAFSALPVLLYDRRPLSHRAIRKRLEYWGCEVASARNRRALMAALQQRPGYFQRLILSLSQRECEALDRSTFLGPARELFEGEVILISGADSSHLEKAAPGLLRQLHPFALLQKPFTSHALVMALHGENDAAATEAGNDTCNANDSGRLTGLRVLVAEDNGFNQMLISRMLELHGAEVMVAGDGTTALQQLQSQPVDLILMDIHMPLMDGIEATRAIRALSGPQAQVPIITLSANIVENDTPALQELGIAASLSKPIDEEALIEQVQRCCTGAPPAADPLASRLTRYGISDRCLQRELQQQLAALRQGFERHDTEIMRDHSHQLMGLAGLLGIAPLDQAALAFNAAVKGGQEEQIRNQLEQLEQQISAIGAGSREPEPRSSQS